MSYYLIFVVIRISCELHKSEELMLNNSYLISQLYILSLQYLLIKLLIIC